MIKRLFSRSTPDTAGTDTTGQDKSGQQQPVPDPAMLIEEQLGWFYKQNRRLTVTCVTTTLLLTASLGMNFVQWNAEPETQYFAVSSDLRVKELDALSEPAITDSGLVNWVSETITATFTLSFRHWRDQLSEVQPQYSEEAFRELVDDINQEPDGILAFVRNRNAIATAETTQAPIIESEGELPNGRYGWRIEVPVQITYEDSQGVIETREQLVTVVVQRASAAETPNGVELRQVVVEPR